MLETIRLLFEYTRWADNRMFDAVAALPAEAWTKDLRSSLKSVRDTVVHVVSSQWIWLSRWQGTSPPKHLDPAEFPDVATIRARREIVSGELAAHVAAQTEASIAAPLAYLNLKGEPFSYPLDLQMLHVANHSTYHRGQVTTLLRQLGAQPISTDLVLYYAERAKRA
jgi:uncharacterized damage-inducible protein DinB